MASNPPPPSRAKARSPVNQAAKPQPSAPVRLKTIVRRLPPNLPEAVFWRSVEPWVSEESVGWKIFYPGKLRKKLNKENIPSRAYILFKNEDSLASFSRGYDGHLFRDKQGNESQAVVEFAPNQKVPPEKKKADSRHATIQQDEDYLSFIATLQNPPPKAAEVDVEALLAATQASEEPATTPLLAALQEQKASAQGKKLIAPEVTRVHSKKVAPSGAASVQKAVGEDPVQPAAKKSRKGKGAHHSGASAPSTAPTPSNNLAAKPNKSSASRNRQAATTGNAQEGLNLPTPTTSSGHKEPSGQGADEASQKRSRPIIGLQSRHLKAALNGVGVAASSISQSASVSASSDFSAPVAGGAVRLSIGPRDPTGGGGGGGSGETHHEKAGRESNVKNVGGGRGGKERARSRHTSGPGLGRGTDATPRILTRQDFSTATLSLAEGSRDRVAPSGSQEAAGTRGKNKRGR